MRLGRLRFALAPAIALACALPASAQAGVAPRAVGQLDCNGFSPIQQELRPTADCADIRGLTGGRFYDNGWYIGHDEPSLRFISNAAGSADDITFVERLGTDPSQLPTVKHPGADVTHYFELTPAPWFSMTVCDPNSTPETTCTAESDSNAPSLTSPGGGAAFVELQFYPPGYAPFADNTSCDNTRWCSALTIDSLECSGSGNSLGTCNNDCTEPVNFAFVQKDGVPTGPPSPQLSDITSVTPNGETLLMKPGDVVKIHMFDEPVAGGAALEVTEDDLTTGQSGFMIASATNGFMNTDPTTCDGTPFNFQPEYSSAAAPNVVPWGPGPYEINTEFEVGHFEPCTQVTGMALFSLGAFNDPYWLNCHGPYENRKENSSLEPDDSPCYRFADTHGGTAPPNEVTGCDVFDDAIGDLDYDGNSYRADWPTSANPGTFPGSFEQAQPTSGGVTYPEVQFMTDLSATEASCNVVTGAGCVVPPTGPGNFYPYWTLGSYPGLGCTWEFGNVKQGQTFGGDAQYGSVTPTSLEAFTSAVIANPSCTSG